MDSINNGCFILPFHEAINQSLLMFLARILHALYEH